MDDAGSRKINWRLMLLTTVSTHVMSAFSAKLNSVAFANANERPTHSKQADDFTVVSLIAPTNRGDHPGCKIEESS